MKKFIFSLFILLSLVACSSSATPESLLDSAVNKFENDNFKIKMNIASIYDNSKVRIVNDNIGDVELGEDIKADVKVSLDGSYEDAVIEYRDGSYLVVLDEENFTFSEEEYIEEIASALYGEFRSLLNADVENLESSKDKGTTLSFDLSNAAEIYEILSLNEMHDLTTTDVSGNATLNFADNKNLDSGILFVEFIGDLDGSEFSGSVKLDFSVIK